MFLHFYNLYVVLTHLSKPFRCPSTGRPFLSTVLLDNFWLPFFKHNPAELRGLLAQSPDVTSKTQPTKCTWLISYNISIRFAHCQPLQFISANPAHRFSLCLDNAVSCKVAAMNLIFKLTFLGILVGL